MVAVLTAYSTQLKFLRVVLYGLDSSSELLPAALTCTQLSIAYCDTGVEDERQRRPQDEALYAYVDLVVPHLHGTVASLPPLLHLRTLLLYRLTLSDEAMATFLLRCPTLKAVRIRDTRSASLAVRLLHPSVGREVAIKYTN